MHASTSASKIDGTLRNIENVASVEEHLKGIMLKLERIGKREANFEQ